MMDRATNILIVDDDELDVMNVKRAFNRDHPRDDLFVATNGLEALDLLRGDQLPRERRLVLLDLNMPRMNGIEFLQELRQDPRLRSTPVVVLTTSDDERDKVAAYRFNVAGYLVKPVTFRNFVELMATLKRYWTLAEIP